MFVGDNHKAPAPHELLQRDEPEAFERIDFGSAGPVLVVCDHARNRVPRSLGRLGLADHHLSDHIGWDIGAEGVAKALAERLGSTVIVGQYSRLVVDLNRAARDPSVIPAMSDGILVPGNVGIDPLARKARIESIHEPYHAAVDAVIAEKHEIYGYAAMIAVHSFTPRISGIWRPWHAGVLWDKDSRIAVPLLQSLWAQNNDVVVGDNEPYSGRHTADYTIDLHAEGGGLAYAGIEIRQDQIQWQSGQTEWAERLHAALEPVLEKVDLSTVWQQARAEQAL